MSQHHFALLSLTFMISTVLVFDRVHYAGFLRRFFRSNLLSMDEVERLRNIMAACQEAA
jgi:hypothetical protein